MSHVIKYKLVFYCEDPKIRDVYCFVVVLRQQHFRNHTRQSLIFGEGKKLNFFLKCLEAKNNGISGKTWFTSCGRRKLLIRAGAFQMFESFGYTASK